MSLNHDPSTCNKSNSTLKVCNFSHIWFPNVLRATTMCTFSTWKGHWIVQKVVRTPGVSNLFHFQVCFALQGRALFQHHQNFQKSSEAEGFDASYLQICFSPQRCALFPHFSPIAIAASKSHPSIVLCASLLPRVPCACRNTSKSCPRPMRFAFFFSNCVSSHNRMHFFHISTRLSKIVRDRRVLTLLTCTSPQSQLPKVFLQLLWHFSFHLVSWLRARHFSEPTFRASGATKHFFEHRKSCDFPNLSRFRSPASSLLWVSLTFIFSLLTSPPIGVSCCLCFFLVLLFHLSMLSEV